MSSKKKQETKNTYEYMAPPVTQELTTAKNVSQDLRGQINPRIRSNFAGMRQDVEEQFVNPMGQYTTQAVRDATVKAGKQSLAQQENQALNEADFMSNATDFERQMAMAAITTPNLVQTGGTTTSTESGGVLKGVLGGVMGLGGAALGNPAIM